MNWTLRTSTTCTSKLLADRQEKGKFIAYHVAYLTKAYGIPLSLIVNNDQIGIHLVPITREHIWESRGSKHINVFGIKDK
jgi:hypothetical protein